MIAASLLAGAACALSDQLSTALERVLVGFVLGLGVAFGAHQ